MRLPLLRRMLNVAALGTGVALAAFTASSAHAGVEVGATAGLHVFSINNELGVPDTVKATSLRNSALFGLRLGFMFNDMIGVEAEAGIIPSEDRNLVYDVFTGTLRGHVIAQFRAANPANKLVPFAVLGGGATKVLSSDREDRIDLDTDAALYVGVGAKYRVENGWGLRADGRLLLPPSSKNESAALDGEILLSVYKEFGRKEAPKGEEPPPVVEEDKDPDKDGIMGDADQCPTEAEDADGFEDENGCPDPDNDNDTVLDASDQCPTDAEDADGFKDDDGCPDPDNDGDGVLDAADTCPDKMETKNGYQDGDGCPDEVPAALAKFTGVIKGINFKTGSAEILKTSNKILDKAVKVMQDYPDIKLEIQGHTDDVGDDAANLELSQKRAESVKAYFEAKGVPADRVTAKGYGETAPSAPIDGLKGGKLKAAQAKNRRVEFKLLSDLQQ